MLSGVNRPGLIEAVISLKDHRDDPRYPGLFAPAPLTLIGLVAGCMLQLMLSGVNRPGLIEA